jgi:hypothetical protein
MPQTKASHSFVGIQAGVSHNSYQLVSSLLGCHGILHKVEI